MTPKTIRISGKTLSAAAVIITGIGTFLVSLNYSLLPGDMHDMVYALSLFCVALSAYLAHKKGDVE